MCTEKNNNLCNIDKYSGYNIGKRIKETAYAQNITIKELCTRAGLSVNYINQMTGDNRQPRAIALASIADVLNISLDFLLDRQQQPPTADIPLSQAIQVVAAAAHITPQALAAVLHLPINDK